MKMSIKKLGAVFMAIVMIFSLATVAGVQKAYADTSDVIDRYSEDDYLIKNDGKLWFVQEPGGTLTLIGYKGVLSETFEIPTEFDGYPVTAIGAEAFRNSTELTGVLSIPSCIESIGDRAFEGCTSLEGVEFKYGLKYIGTSAFDSCTGLKGSLIFPNSVESIGDAAFEFCRKFNGTLKFPENAKFTKIPGHLIYHAGTFTGEIVIPDSVTEIASNAFHFGYFDDATLTLSKNLKKIGHWAFFACSGIKGNLELPDGLETIEYGAFSQCSGFTGDLYIPNSVKIIEYDAFKGMSGLNGTLHISENVEKIGNSAFESCSSLTGDIIIPDSVKEIGEAAFRYSRGFTGSITFPDNESFTEIKNDTFNLCEGLTGVVNIPEGVTRIGDKAFYDCGKLTGVVLPQGLHKICYDAFCYCQSLTGSLDLPGSLTEIGYGAFDHCENLTGSLTIPRGVETVESYAFRACSGLNGTLTIENGVKNINQYAFASCTGFTGDLAFPESVTGLGERAFYYCTGLNGTLNLNKITYFGNYALYGCSGLTGPIVFNEDLREIGAYAFYECSGLTGDLIIPEKTSAVHQFAFDGCTGLTGTLSIPASVTTIGSYAFGDDFFGTIINNSERTIKVECKEDADYPTNYIFNSTNREIYCYRDANDVRVSEIAQGTYTLSRINNDPSSCEHEWELTATVTPAGCVVNGGGEYTCGKCGTTKLDVIPALGHDMLVEEFGTQATCTEDGTLPYCYCRRCGNYYIDSEGKEQIDGKPVIKATGHSYKDVVTVKATLTKDGKIVPTCSACGDKKAEKTIAKASGVKVSATSFTYNGKAQKPTLTVKDSAGKTISKKYYTATWSNSSSNAPGSYTVKVTFKGNYSGSKTLTYKILPRQVTGLKASKVAKDSITVTWTKRAEAKAYKVEYSSDGSNWKSATVTTNTYTLKSLKAGSKWQFRVKALDSTKKVAGKVSATLKTGTLTAAPKISKLTSTKSKTATVTWAKVTGAKSYLVFKSTDNKNWDKGTSTTKTTLTLSKLTGGKKIYVKVVAVNAYGKASADSAVKSVTVKK